MFDDLTDKIYEAAFVPELWGDALEAAGSLSGSATGAIFLFSGDSPVRGRLSDVSPVHGNSLRSVFDDLSPATAGNSLTRYSVCAACSRRASFRSKIS
ncbi:hypothetical protein [Mesorhizobium sp.]|uniref:hypothetical protein n=1 Tax=Mesorhizobium sp. TaxID=1871066 RepID=UPI002579E106|nr:hypothetical protein [Mesorhizobium sp.]